MRLLYLYVNEWDARGIVPEYPIELNFETGFAFHCENRRLWLSYSRRLSPNFFSTRPLTSTDKGGVSKEATIVESVSVIVGDNGSGKTSIAAILHKLFRRGRPSPLYVCVYSKGRDLFCYQNQRTGMQIDCKDVKEIATKIGYRWIDVDDDIHLPTEYRYLSDVKCYERPFDVIYYSPFLPTQDIWGDVARDGFHDVSTGHYLLGNELMYDKNIGSDLPIDKVAKLYLFDRTILLRYAHDYVNLLGKKGKDAESILPIPRYARIDTPSDILERFRDWQLSERNNEADKKQILDDVRFYEVISGVSSQQDGNVAVRYVSCLMLDAMIQLPVGNITKEKVAAFRSLMELLILLKKAVAQGNVPQSLYIDNSIRYLGINTRSLRRLAICLLRASIKGNRHGGVGSFIIDLKTREGLDDVLDVMRVSNSIGKNYNNILKVSLADMSSGEMAYWTLFSRLYNSLVDHRLCAHIQCGPQNDMLIFLDETETTLHPDWQRRIVRSVIWFFERFTKGLRVHIVFATHSPMILSDVPKGNVAFLFRDRKTPLGHLKSSRKNMAEAFAGLHNTFGANIYDLYGSGFFLQDSPVGEFAREKINSVLKKLAKDGTGRLLDDGDKQLVLLIGDNFIRKYMESCISSH